MLLQWISLSLFAPFIWAAAGVGDRFLCIRGIRNEYAMTVAGAICRLPLFIAFLWASNWFIPSLPNLLLALAAGVCVVLPVVFYLRALKSNDSSQVILVYYALSPIVTFILSIIFLGETFNWMDITGTVLLMISIFFSIVRFKAGFLKFRTSTLWILIGCILWPISDVIVKYLGPFFPSLVNLLAWECLGGFLAVFLYFLFPEFIRHCKFKDFKWPRSSWVLFIFIMLIFQFGNFVLFKALLLERVALTIVITSTQPLMNFAIEWVVQKFVPSYEKMDLGWRSLLPKGMAFCLMITGIWFFTF